MSPPDENPPPPGPAPPSCRRPGLACVVIALGSPPELPEAVRSLLDQSEPAEVVVVNSGGGDAAAVLAAAGLAVPVIDRRERLFAGGARNLGIAATTAPFVAFLAADCRAEPGWVAARLEAHRRGAAAVASAVTNADRHSVVAWTAQVALFAARMPGLAAEEALRYGASYDRRLLVRHGSFREDLRAGEDTELHRRIGDEVEIVWEPRVRTAHRHPLRLGHLLRDQVRRGRRMAAAWDRLDGPAVRAVALDALRRQPRNLALAWRGADSGDRPWIASTVPLLGLAALAYAWGALSAPKATAAAGAGAVR